MADLRTLTLGLLVKDDQFRKGLKDSQKASQTFSQKLGKALKVGAAAFAAAGAAASAFAVKVGKDAVEAAVADQKSQLLLADALRNSTKATDNQIKSTEEYIRKTQLATGVSDSQLRPALANLARATGDLTKAEKLNTLALDISVATGKDLESVSLALAKAYNGNIGALTRLGVPLDQSIIKSKDFGAATAELEKLFGGSAAAAADTYAGRLAIINERIGEAQEALGEALLPILDRVSKFIANSVVPAFEGLVRGLTGGPRSVRGATKETNSAFADLGIVFDENDTAAYNLGLALRDLADTLAEVFGTAANGTTPESGLVRFINFLERIVNFVDKAIEGLRELNRILTVDNPFSKFGEAIGRSISTDNPLTPSQQIVNNLAQNQRRQNTQPIVVNNFNNIVTDPQRTARTITNVLTQQRTISGVKVSAPSGFF